jgi:hypothetical protein
VGKIEHITVIFHVLNESMRASLKEIRESHGQTLDQPVRVSFSMFKEAGGDKYRVLKELNLDDNVLNKRGVRAMRKTPYDVACRTSLNGSDFKVTLIFKRKSSHTPHYPNECSIRLGL